MDVIDTIGQYLAFKSQNWEGRCLWWVFWYNNDNDNDNDGTCSKVLDLGFALTKMCTRS